LIPERYICRKKLLDKTDSQALGLSSRRRKDNMFKKEKKLISLLEVGFSTWQAFSMFCGLFSSLFVVQDSEALESH